MLVAALVIVLIALATAPARAVLSGAEWEEKTQRDPDLAAAAQAVQSERWPEAVSILKKVIERRPFDDDALTLLGYAYRKLGDYDRALQHYRRALELNPYHVGAMEYLGEAYVETGRADRARELLDRIEATCRRTHGDATWRERCSEWTELQERIEAAR